MSENNYIRTLITSLYRLSYSPQPSDEVGLEPTTSRLKGEVSDNICIATVYYNLYSENIDNSLKTNLISHNGFEPFKNLFKNFY